MTSWLYQYYAQLTRSINVPTADEYGVIGGIPGWVLQPNNTPATFDVDFANNRAFMAKIGSQSPSHFLTCSRSTGGYAQTAEGTLQWFPANQLRITDLGLLVEEGSANYCLFSQVFTNAAWNLDNAMVAASTILAPDGSPTADLLIAQTTNAQHRIFQSAIPTVVNDTTSIASVYVRSAGYQYVQLQINANGAVYGGWANFDLVNGVVTGTQGLINGTELNLTPSITPLANGWYRISIALTHGANSAGNNQIQLAIINSPTMANGTTWSGDGTSGVLAWGAQVEGGTSAGGGQKMYPTSYYPTVAAAATRASDLVSMPFASVASWNFAKGSLFFRGSVNNFEAANLLGGNNYQCFVGSDQTHYEGTLNAGQGNQCQLNLNSTSGGGNGASLTTFPPGQTATPWSASPTQCAFAWNSSGPLMQGCVNGGAVGADNTHTPDATGVTTFYIGSSRTNFGFYNGYVTRCAIWGNVALPSASLSALSELPYWLLSIGGQAATLDLDFVNNRGWSNGVALPLASIITCTRLSSSYYTTAGGVLQLFNPSEARFWDNGLLSEEASTNLAWPSTPDTGTHWSQSNTASTANATAAPDATTTATSIVDNASATTHFALDAPLSGALTSATPYAFSIYAKANALGQIGLNIQGAAGNYISVVFDLLHGVVGDQSQGATSGTITSAIIQPLANGWYRCILVGQITGTGTPGIFLAPAATGNTFTTLGLVSYTGTVKGVYAWGAQVEQFAYATSLITTTTVAVTRPADGITLTPSFYNQAQGTWYLDFVTGPDLNAVGGASRTVATISDAGFNNFQNFSPASGTGERYNFKVNAGAQQTISGDTANLNTEYTQAASYQSGNYEAAFRGSLAAPNSQAGVPILTGASTFNLGSFQGAGSGNLGGRIKRLSYVPTAVVGSALAQASGVPNWVLQPGGNLPALDLDFIGKQGYAGNAAATLASLLTVTNSGGYYTTAVGTLVSFAANTLRVGDQGLLVEESRTNVVAGSQSFTGGNGWTIVSATMTNNAAAAPDGTTTAATLVEAAATSDHVMIPGAITVAVNTQISCSVYVKQAPGTRHLWMSCYDAVSATNGIAALFNLTTGAVAGSGSAGDGSGASATITTLANGWYRCTISGITSVAAHANAILRIALSNATTFSQSVDTSYAGDGTSGLTLWGAQAEVGGAFATSYIPTATTSATRAADNIGFVSQSWQTGNLGTYYGQLTALPGNASGRIWGASASSADIVGLAGNTQVEGFNGTQELTASAGSGGWSTGAKGAAAADVSGRSVCMNAGTVASDANGLGTLTTMFIGSNSGSNCANGYIGRVAYWKSRLAAVLLQNITT